MESTHEWTRRQKQRSVRQPHIALLQTAQVVPRQLWLANGTGRQIEKLVAITMYHLIELCYAGLRPVCTYHWYNGAEHWQDLTQNIWPTTVGTMCCVICFLPDVVQQHTSKRSRKYCMSSVRNFQCILAYKPSRIQADPIPTAENLAKLVTRIQADDKNQRWTRPKIGALIMPECQQVHNGNCACCAHTCVC